MKRTLIYFTALLAAATATAEILSPAEALARIDAGSGARKIASRAAVDVTPARVVALDGSAPELYLFTPDSGGMLLVSAESETPALIGYTDNYTPGAEMPPALEWMMNCWAAEIEAQRAGNVIRGNAPEGDFAPVEPICKTRWDQGAPYNDQCPVLGGYRSYTGCVATALAQVLKVYEYPEKCSGGTYSYKWTTGGQTLSMNFDDVTLDWDNMVDVYTSSATDEQKNAVATLMKAIGYACDMEYSYWGSGADSRSGVVGLVRNFGYDCTAQHLERSWFTLSQWQEMVYDVLASGYPLYYDGVTADAEPVGHAFVVDGYKSDGYFHLNWGWGGVSDGYFRLTALDPEAQGIGGAYPSAGFDISQGAIFNLNPGATTPQADAPLTFFTTDAFYATSKSVTLGSSAGFYYAGQGAVYNLGCVTASSARMAVKFTHENGTVYHAAASSTFPQTKPFFGAYGSASISIPTTLADGDYTVSPAILNAASGKYYDIYIPIGCGNSFPATVSNGTITFGQTDYAKLTATEFTAPEIIVPGVKYVATIKLTNSGELYYDGLVEARLATSVASSSSVVLGGLSVALEPGESGEFSASLLLSEEYIGKSGEYVIYLQDRLGNRISEPVNVTVQSAAKLTTTKLECVNPSIDNLVFKVTVEAAEGEYNAPIVIQLNEKGNYNTYVTRIESDPVSIGNGASAEVTVTGKFPEGVIGMDYTTYVYYDYKGELTETSGHKRLNFTLLEDAAIDEISASDASAPVSFYDLAGRRIANPAKGVYLMRRGSTVTKVVR